MSRRSSEPRDRDHVGQPDRAWSNRGRCLDCHRFTRRPELCLECIDRLAGEGR